MSTLQFLSWSRRGVGAATDAGQAGSRRLVTIPLEVTADTNDQPQRRQDVPSAALTVLGPADVEPHSEDLQIVRRCPHRTDHPFEPNLLAAIEFAHPDLPWLFSPRSLEGSEHLAPWLMLVVVDMPHEREATALVSTPLARHQVLRIDNAAEVPNPNDAWAFAHIQVSDDDAAHAIDTVKSTNPQVAEVRSRVVCPTRLAPSRRYFAALVPTFESGRRVGIGIPEGDAGTAMWDPARLIAADHHVDLPVYDGWFFDTGPAGDFEMLARRLTPLAQDQYQTLGVRRVTIESRATLMQPQSTPDLFAPAVHDIPTAIATTDAPGPLAPPPDAPQPAEQAAGLHRRLKELVDIVAAATDSDPVVGPPLYGRWPAEVLSLDGRPDDSDLAPVAGNDRQTWIEQINADPYLRIAAGLGTRLVQKDQEEFMADAWAQLSDLMTVNLRIRWATVMSAAMTTLHARLSAATPTAALRLAAPALARLVDADGVTVHAALGTTTLPAEALSAPLARAARYAVRATRYSDATVSVSSTVTGLVGALAASEPAALPLRFSVAPGIDTATVGSLFSVPALADRVQSRLGASPSTYLTRVADVPAIMKRIAANVVNTVDPAPSAAPHVSFRLDDVAQLRAQRLAERVDVTRVSPALRTELIQLNGAAVPQRSLSLAAVGALSRVSAQPVTAGTAGRFTQFELTDQPVQLGAKLFGAQGSIVAASGAGLRAQAAGAAEGIKLTALMDVGIAAPVPDDLLGTLGEADTALVHSAISDITANFVPSSATPSTPPGLQRFSDTISQTVITAIEPPTAYAKMLAFAHQSFSSRVVRRPDWQFHPAMAAPTIATPLVQRLTALDREWILGGVGKLPTNKICLLQINRRFVEALLVGANHEFGREMLWRGYPTDLRGSSFRRFWDAGTPDIAELTRWISPIGSNGADGVGKERTVLVIKGDLLRRYPNTLISAERGTTSAVSGATTFSSDQVVAPELFRGSLGSDVTYSVLDIAPSELRTPLDGNHLHCWYISLLEPYDELRFGLDDQPGSSANERPVDHPDGARDYTVTNNWTWQGFGDPAHLNAADHLQTASSAVACASLLQLPFRLLLRAPDYMPPEA